MIFGELAEHEATIAHGNPSPRLLHRTGVLWSQLAMAATLWPRWGKRRSFRFASKAEQRFTAALELERREDTPSTLVLAAIHCDQIMNSLLLGETSEWNAVAQLIPVMDSLRRLLSDSGYSLQYAAEIRHQLGICLDFLARCTSNYDQSEVYSDEAQAYFTTGKTADGGRAERSFLLARALRQPTTELLQVYTSLALRSAHLNGVRMHDPQYIRTWMIHLYGKRGEWLVRRLQHPFA